MKETKNAPKRPESLIAKIKDSLSGIEEKTGIKGYVFLAGLILCVSFVYLSIMEGIITNLVGTVYPSFCTMRSINMRGDEKIKWLTYWVVFASFSICDMFSPLIVRFVPFYFFMKIIFLIWLFMPNSNGAHLIYHILVKRVFSSFESDIDFASDTVKLITNEVVESTDSSALFKRIKTMKSFFSKAKPSADNKAKNKKSQ